MVCVCVWACVSCTECSLHSYALQLLFWNETEHQVPTGVNTTISIIQTWLQHRIIQQWILFNELWNTTVKVYQIFFLRVCIWLAGNNGPICLSDLISALVCEEQVATYVSGKSEKKNECVCNCRSTYDTWWSIPVIVLCVSTAPVLIGHMNSCVWIHVRACAFHF